MSLAVTVGLSPTIALDGGETSASVVAVGVTLAIPKYAPKLSLRDDETDAVHRLDEVLEVGGRAGQPALPQPRIFAGAARERERRDALAQVERGPGIGAVTGVGDPHLIDRRRRVADDLRGERDAAGVELRVDGDDGRRVGQRGLAQVAAVEQAQVHARVLALRARSVDRRWRRDTAPA